MLITKQKGNVVAFIIPLILMGFVFAYLFSHLSCFVPVGGPVPYVFVSLFLFPIAAIFPLIKDVTEIQEGMMTKTESKRLSSMVLNIQNYLKASAFLLLVFGSVTAVLLYLVQVKALEAKPALSGIGFLLGSGIYVLIFLFSIRVKLQNFKVKLSCRARERNQKRKLLKKIQRKKTNS